jgi:hypothetical protein
VPLVLLLVTGAHASTSPDPVHPPDLGVSPLLVDAAGEVWGIIARPDNPVWPGWNASDTPLLLYLPGRQDMLIGHPYPTEGFVLYDGPLRFPGATIWVKNGPTIVEADGQNTAMDVAGVRTLVVADPLSNLRQNIAGLLEDPRPAAEKARTLEFRSLAPDPYDQLALIVHEAFHVYEDKVAPDRGANEMLLLWYPVLSVDNNVGFGLEASALAGALAADDDAAFRAAALRWLAVREHRRALLTASARAYEDGVEFSEGMATYTEYRLFQVLEGRTPPAALEHAQGFHGYRDLSDRRRALVAQMLHHLRGEVNVNNAPFGTAPLRMRLYYSGMAIGVMLDRLSPTWKHDLIATDSSLTALANDALHATPDELARAWKEARADTLYPRLIAAKQRLRDEGQRDAEARVAAIEHGPGTGIIVDYSQLASDKMSLAFTPFGITAVDSVRTIFDQVPITVHFADDSELRESFVLPLLRDAHRRLVRCRLERIVARAEIERLAGAGRVGAVVPVPVRLELPGVTLDLKHATLEWRDGTLRAVLHPAPAAAGGEGAH